MSVWHVLEQIRGLTALPVVWKKRTGDFFLAFQTLCLDPAPLPALSYRCPLESSCAYSIKNQKSKNENGLPFLGVCQLEPPRCPQIDLSLADITPLQLNWPKLGRAICRALSLDAKAGPLSVPNTLQIGSWSADAIPVLLSIQTERHHLHFVICELIARLRQRFIVLTPTSKHYDAKTQELLVGANSAIFAFDTIVTLQPDGTLVPTGTFQVGMTSTSSPFSSPIPQSKIEIQKSKIVTSRHPSPGTFSLRKGLGFWTLIFDGQEAVLKHERGLFYIAWLLTHPHECPIHALDLMAKIPEIYRQQLAMTEITDPETGKLATLESHARLQERSLSLDDAQAMRALFRKQKELEAILDDPEESEPVKAEALRDLEAISQFQKQNAQRTRSGAQRAANSVRMAIARLHEQLAASPNPVLAEFAGHIDKHILIPSRRYASKGNQYARSGLAGCFTYEEPTGVHWLK